MTAPGQSTANTLHLKYLALLIGCNAIWAGNTAWSKILLENLKPLELACLRYGSAAVVMTLLLVARGPRAQDNEHQETSHRPHWGWMVLAGATSFFASPVLNTIGLNLTRASVGSLTIALEPLITIGMAILFLREVPHRLQWIALVLGLAGFFVLAGWGAPQAPESARDASGPLLIALSLIGEATYSVVGRHLGRLFPGFGDRYGLAFLTGALWAGVAGLFIALAAWHGPSGLPGLLEHLTRFSLREWVGLLWLGPLGTAVAYWVWFRLMSHVSVVASSNTLLLQPVLGAFIGVVVFGDLMGWDLVLGGFMVVVASGLAQWAENQE